MERLTERMANGTVRRRHVMGESAMLRLAAYEDTGLTPEQIEAQQQEIDLLKAEITELEAALEDRSKSCIIFDKENTKLNADKDEQAGRLMRYDTVLKQAKTAINNLMSCNEISKIADVRGEDAIKAIDALLGGKEE